MIEGNHAEEVTFNIPVSPSTHLCGMKVRALGRGVRQPWVNTDTRWGGADGMNVVGRFGQIDCLKFCREAEERHTGEV